MMQNKKQKRKISHTLRTQLHEEEHRKKRRHAFSWLGLALFFIGALFLQQNIDFLKTDLLQVPQHAPFDGTTYPLQKSPDWVHLTSTEYKLTYDQIPANKMLPLPKYEPEKLSMSTEGFQWNNAEHNAIRNAKITYSVPYMGSYRLNGKEYDGSHLAVDIKIPEKTPVYAIANGVVVKISNITTGFGKHVVLQHNDVPSYDNPSVRETLFSGYNHLSSIAVTEGQVVKKGDLIAYSGSTGFATTPHLHFQIDKDDADWHPYWPFTYKEQADAGLDFVGAVNAGLGKEKAILMTVPPMQYVQKYLNFTPSANPETTPPVVSTPPETTPSVPVSSVQAFEFSIASSFETDDAVTFQIFAKDKNGQNVSSFDGEGILLIMGNVATLPRASLTSADFIDGVATLSLQDLRPGNGQLVFLYQGKQFSSQSFEVKSPSTSASVENTAAPLPAETSQNPPVSSNSPSPVSFDGSYDENVSSYDIRLMGTIHEGDPVTVVVRALDHSGNIIPDFKPSVSINIELLKGHADLSKLVLISDDFQNGEATFTLTPKDSSALSLKITSGSLSTVNHVYKDQLFADVDGLHPYYEAIRYLKQKDVLGGYPDGTFQPDRKVSRVEALKILVKGANRSIVSLDTPPFYKDVKYSEWYGPFIMTAYQANIARGYPDNTFKPTQSVKRAEFIKMLLESMLTSISPFVTEKPYEDVPTDQWFSPYVAYAKMKNLLPKNTTSFRPDEEITRDEVAEILYRVLVIRETQATAYAPGIVQ